jgi:hypothetical protein
MVDDTQTYNIQEAERYDDNYGTKQEVISNQINTGRVRCFQCGTLFSTSGSACDTFDSSDPEQQDFCQPGEVCLWYSWRQSDSTVSVIRECLSKAVLLGSVDNPLIVQPFCEPQVIAEDSGSRTEACLCDSDLCNLRQVENKPEIYRSVDNRNEVVPNSKNSINEGDFIGSLTEDNIFNNEIFHSSAVRSNPERVK